MSVPTVQPVSEYVLVPSIIKSLYISSSFCGLVKTLSISLSKLFSLRGSETKFTSVHNHAIVCLTYHNKTINVICDTVDANSFVFISETLQNL